MSLFVIPHPDLWDTSLTNPDLISFVEGSCCKDGEGNFQADYAVTIQYELLERGDCLQINQPNG